MNNIQSTIVFLLISGVVWMLLEPWGYYGLDEGIAIFWLVITAAVGFFLFRNKK